MYHASTWEMFWLSSLCKPSTEFEQRPIQYVKSFAELELDGLYVEKWQRTTRTIKDSSNMILRDCLIIDIIA